MYAYTIRFVKQRKETVNVAPIKKLSKGKELVTVLSYRLPEADLLCINYLPCLVLHSVWRWPSW